MAGGSAGSPVRAMLHMEVRPGCGAEFERAWEKVADAASRSPGNLRQALLRVGPDAYVVTSDWMSREAFSAFERSPDQDGLTAPLRALRVNVRMEVAEIVLHVDGAVPTPTS
jgi:heme-degrading monooxygenase HmoA